MTRPTCWQYRPDAFTRADITAAIELFKTRPCGAGLNGHVVIWTAYAGELPQLDGVEWMRDE